MKSYDEIIDLAKRIEKCVVFVHDTIQYLETCNNSEFIFSGRNNINGLYYSTNPLGIEVSRSFNISPIMHLYHYKHTDAYSGFVGSDSPVYIWYKSITFCDIYGTGTDSKKVLINISDYTEEMFFQDSLVMDQSYQEAYILMCHFYEKKLPKFKFDIDQLKYIEDVIEHIQTRTEIR